MKIGGNGYVHEQLAAVEVGGELEIQEPITAVNEIKIV